MDRNHQIAAALSEVINAPDRPPALYPLARIKYPAREIRPTAQSDGCYQVKLPLYGWEYKHRGPRRLHSIVDCAAIQAALNTALSDGIIITAVETNGKHVSLFIVMEDKAYEEDVFYGDAEGHHFC